MTIREECTRRTMLVIGFLALAIIVGGIVWIGVVMEHSFETLARIDQMLQDWGR